MVTRLIGVIPAATVAAAVGNKGLNTMLVASQVILSIILPSVIFPLVYLCSRKEIMVVDGPEVDSLQAQTGTMTPVGGDGERRRKRKGYTSPMWVTVLGYALFTVVIAANVYVIVELILGNQ
jgi:metal iron transporter